VLVEHGLGHAGGIRDLVHRRVVEAAVGEHLQCNAEKLLPPSGGWKARGHAVRCP
jgi:hypothetical protein